MNGNLFRGIQYFFEGFKLMFKPGLRLVVLIPLLINIVLFFYASWYALSIFDNTITWFVNKIPSWLEFLKWILWPLAILTLGTGIFFLSNMIANIIASPFNGILAEKTERLLKHESNEEPFSFVELLKIVPESIVRELHKLKYYLPRILILTLFSFIPGVNVLVFIFAAWMMAVQYIDFPMDNHKIVFNSMIEQIKTKNLSALGFGGIVMLALMIPVLNLIVIPAAVCGATRFYLEELQ